MTEFKRHPVHGLLISSDGTIIGRRGSPLRPSTTSCGYRMVTISTNGALQYKTVHRLVAETFVAGAADGLCVNHKDGNKANNCASNLEWCTRADNNRHALASGLRNMSVRRGHKDSTGALNGRAKLTAEQVREIRSLSYGRGDRPWLRYGLSNAQFYAIRNRKSWKHVE